MERVDFNTRIENELGKCWRALGHEYINYLHDISLRVQLGKETSEIISYIEELSVNLKNVRTFTSNWCIYYNMSIQQLLLKLVTAGYKFAYSDEVNSKRIHKFNLKSLETVVQLLIDNCNSIDIDDRFIELGLNNNRVEFCMPYVEIDNIKEILKDYPQIIINIDEDFNEITLII